MVVQSRAQQIMQNRSFEYKSHKLQLGIAIGVSLQPVGAVHLLFALLSSFLLLLSRKQHTTLQCARACLC